jgi:predicted membrane metal-binding protein
MSSRSHAFWLGARRGLRLGAYWGFVIALVLMWACVGLAVFIPDLRREMFDELKDMHPLAAIGSAVAPIALIVLYGALTGAVVVGIVTALRANQQRPNDLSTTTLDAAASAMKDS